MAILMMASGLALADTANVDVTANIKGVCRIESIQSVDFGDLEQGTTAADKTAPGAVNYWCTKGVAYTVTLGMGTNPTAATRNMFFFTNTATTERQTTRAFLAIWIVANAQGPSIAAVPQIAALTRAPIQLFGISTGPESWTCRQTTLVRY